MSRSDRRTQMNRAVNAAAHRTTSTISTTIIECSLGFKISEALGGATCHGTRSRMCDQTAEVPTMHRASPGRLVDPPECCDRERHVLGDHLPVLLRRVGDELDGDVPFGDVAKPGAFVQSADVAGCGAAIHAGCVSSALHTVVSTFARPCEAARRAAMSSISGTRSVSTTRPAGASFAMLRPGSPVPHAMSRCC